MKQLIQVLMLGMMLGLTACKTEKTASEGGLDQGVPASSSQRAYIQKTYALHVPGCKLTDSMQAYWESRINKPDGVQQMRETMQSIGASNPPCMNAPAAVGRETVRETAQAPRIDTSKCVFGVLGVTQDGVICATEAEATGTRVAVREPNADGRPNVIIVGSTVIDTTPTGVQ